MSTRVADQRGYCGFACRLAYAGCRLGETGTSVGRRFLSSSSDDSVHLYTLISARARQRTIGVILLGPATVWPRLTVSAPFPYRNDWFIYIACTRQVRPRRVTIGSGKFDSLSFGASIGHGTSVFARAGQWWPPRLAFAVINGTASIRVPRAPRTTTADKDAASDSASRSRSS